MTSIPDSDDSFMLTCKIPTLMSKITHLTKAFAKIWYLVKILNFWDKNPTHLIHCCGPGESEVCVTILVSTCRFNFVVLYKKKKSADS